MPDGAVIHRETVPASGTWSVRPAALAGITPKAVLLFGNITPPVADGATGPDAFHIAGISDGINANSHAQHAEDGLGTSNTRTSHSFSDLLYARNADNVEQLRVDPPSFVAGGFDAQVQVNVVNPNIVCIFFWGDDWQAAVGGISMSPTVGGTVTFATGFTGTNDNQIVFDLCSGSANQTSGRGSIQNRGNGLGVAFRQGSSIAPVDQIAINYLARDNTGTSNLPSAFRRGCCQINLSVTSIASEIECTAIRDDEIDLTTRVGTTRRDTSLLVISTGAKRCWAGELASLTANGNWIINGPNFQPVIAGIHTSQLDTDGFTEGNEGIHNIGGDAVGTDIAEFSEMWSNESIATTMNCKFRPNSQFLDAPQDNNTDGWKSGANDFSLTQTGWRVDNVIVDGGGGGAPSTVRKWIGWAIESEGVSGPVDLQIESLTHARFVDAVDVSTLETQLQIDALRHLRPVDDISSLGVSVDLFLSSLRHGRPVDDLDLIVSVDLPIEPLRHTRRVDTVDLQELIGVVIDIDDARHARPVDALLLDVDQPILVDGLRHGRPVNAVDVQLLMGDQTGIGATAAAWVLDAGQSLSNATSIDFGYHVLEGVFDGNQSVLGVDGSRVTGPAGMRELTALTVGADVDGQRRTQGEIAELRIYAGALSQADRDRITQELATKWITG